MVLNNSARVVRLMAVSPTHDAFRRDVVFAKSKFKVKCVTRTWDDKIIVACNDGHFRVYDQRQSRKFFDENIIQDVTFRDCVQIEVIDEKQVMVAIIDGYFVFLELESQQKRKKEN